MEKISIICPCCESKINIDTRTGAILSHEEKKKVLGSFEDLLSQQDKQKELREQLFSQEQAAQKDRSRILDEKFKEAMSHADDEDAEPYRNPLDLD